MDRDTPVVLINGLIGCLDDPLLHARLAPRRVIALDMLGYGARQDVDPMRIDIPAQVEHLHRQVQAQGASRVHLLGHSVGGVVAMRYAFKYPSEVASVISVEGNFTLNDAFWSASVADMEAQRAVRMLAGYRADPAGWLSRAGVVVDPQRLALASEWLDYQPTSTLQAMARSVVALTAASDYLSQVQQVFAHVPVHLLAGAHSRPGWDVPTWAERQAASVTVLPAVGHLMMLEDPQGFAEALAGLLG